MPSQRQEFGKQCEREAADFLRQKGFQILELNYRNRFGEIDIIASDEDTLVFVEVKAKKTGGFVHPKYSVTVRKQKKISLVALSYLKDSRQSGKKARFDVVTLVQDAKSLKIELIKNAFDLAYP